MQELGRLQRVDPRTVWKHEAHDFTPWLREHIDLLAETVGLEFDLVETESAVGNYAVDLYAKDMNTGRWVIIENQLEQTDHSHLGQLMAYAAGKEAGVIIWISTDVRDEHRQTLDWLNEITDETISFFGIELELLRVDNSAPAPHFKLVAQPNEWRKNIGRPPVSSRMQAYEAFFEELLDKVKEKHPSLTRATRAYPQNWFNYPVGRSGFSIAASFAQDKTFHIELYIDMGDRAKNKTAYDALLQQQEEIESRIGQPVVWERLEDKQASRLYCKTAGSIEDDPTHLEELQEWALGLIGTFHKVFRSRVQRLEL